MLRNCLMHWHWLWICVLALHPLLGHAGPLTGQDPVRSTGTVYRTIDADTFVVNLDDPKAYERMARWAAGIPDRERYLQDRHRSIRVRLANIDTPESRHRDPARNSDAGRLAASIVTEMTEGKQVMVSCHDWGRYGRAICNLAIADEGGWLDLGGWLIQHGISPYLTRFGRSPYYHHEYTALEASAPSWP